MKTSGSAPCLARRGGRRTICALALVASAAIVGCEKKTPPDPHIQEGYRLLASDPQAAYDQLSNARNPSDPEAVLGRGLALERLRKYEDAERVLLEARGTTDEPAASLALARVKVVLGKADEARQLVDKVIAAVPSDLSAVLLEACLANDDARARATLSHLDQWLELVRGQMSIPAEYYVAQMSLFSQLRMRAEFETASNKAKQVKLSSESGAFALVELAVKAARRDLAVELLRKIDDEASSVEIRRRVAMLAHGIGDHRLVGRIIEALPGNDARLLSLRAEHEFVTGNARAEETLRTALSAVKDSATKDSATRARLWLLLAEALLRNGKLEQARAETEEMLKEHPNERGALLLARLDVAEGKAEAALKRLAPVLAAQEVPLAAREVAALAHVELGHLDSAVPLLDAVLKEQPSHRRAARLRVALEVKRGKPTEAVRVAEELVAREPKDVGLRLLLAEAARNAGGAAAAAAVLRKSVEAVEGEARLWIALVRALEEQNKAEPEVLAVLEEAHKRLPQAAMLTAALASKLQKMGQAKRAAPLYDALLKGAKDDPIALNNLAMLYADELGNPNRGVELAERAHRLSQVPAIVDTLGWALFKRGTRDDLDRARDLLESVRGQLTSPTSKYHLGAVFIATGKPDEGKRLLRQAMVQSEDFAEAEHARSLLAADP
jgi:predicted Zn-dependent protease